MSEEDMNEQILFIEGDSKITVKNDQIFTNKTYFSILIHFFYVFNRLFADI